jgi:RND family efflux transporter MFP subunit
MQTKLFIGLGLSILIFTTGCKTVQKEDSEKPSVGVRLLRVSNSNYQSSVRSTGTLSSKTESKLSFKTGGIIDRILADEGQSVKKGQLLAELNLEEIQSQVHQADLVMKKADRDFRRAENLYRDSVATLEQFQNASTALDVARANNKIARFNLKYSAIHASSDGKILKRNAEVDEIIAAGHPVFLFASIQNDWVVRANLTDRDVIHVHMLDSARISFDAYNEEVFMGLISEIGTAADPYTGTYEVEIQLLRKPEKLVSGFIARINIYPSVKKEVIIIPYEAMLDGVGLTGYVYVFKDESLHRRKIHIDSFTDQGILVGSGLIEGEEIVIEGTQYLREGSPMHIIETVHQ